MPAHTADPTHRLLHVAASPRGSASESLAIAATFLGAYTETHPHDVVETFDLWDGTLPEFGPAAAAAKMAVFAGADPQDEAALAWTRARQTFERFAAADRYLFSVPMWNAGIPYILEQFIDVVSQPGMVFSFDPDAGYTGLLAGRRAAVVYTGAVYGPGRGPAPAATSSSPTSRTGCAGRASPTSPASRSDPTSPPPTPRPGELPRTPLPVTPARPSSPRPTTTDAERTRS